MHTVCGNATARLTSDCQISTYSCPSGAPCALSLTPGTPGAWSRSATGRRHLPTHCPAGSRVHPTACLTPKRFAFHRFVHPQGGPAPGDAAQPHPYRIGLSMPYSILVLLLPYSVSLSREARRLESQRNRTLARADDVAQRAAAYAAKEEDKLAGLRALLAKGPITIAKRQQ